MTICCEHLAHIEEIARQFIAAAGKPSYTWGRPGNQTSLTWLDNNGVPSNKVGIPFGLNNGRLIELWVGNEDLAEFDIEIYHHEGDEINLTLLVALTVPNTSRVKVFNEVDIGTVNVPKDVQIAARVNNVVTAPRNTSIHATITGSAP